jgi:hypothetical protein
MAEHSQVFGVVLAVTGVIEFLFWRRKGSMIIIGR